MIDNLVTSQDHVENMQNQINKDQIIYLEYVYSGISRSKKFSEWALCYIDLQNRNRILNFNIFAPHISRALNMGDLKPLKLWCRLEGLNLHHKCTPAAYRELRARGVSIDLASDLTL